MEWAIAVYVLGIPVSGLIGTWVYPEEEDSRAFVVGGIALTWPAWAFFAVLIGTPYLLGRALLRFRTCLDGEDDT